MAAMTVFAASQEEVDRMVENLHWLGHDSFRVDGAKTIYFDPWKLSKGAKMADMIFVTHEHFDHLSIDDIKRIATKDTTIVCDRESGKKIGSKAACKELKVVSPGDRLDIDGIGAEATASYNTNKEFHTKASKKVGYIVTIEGLRICHAGDTDFIPEMKDYRCDMALLPVSGTYVMTADEAAEAAASINPKIAVPMHYGDIVGSASDAKAFQDLLKGKIEVKVLKSER